MSSRVTHDLINLCFRNLSRVDTTNPPSLSVYEQHDLGGAHALHVEKPFEDIHDEVHRGVIVVDQNDTVEARSPDIRGGLVRRCPDLAVGGRDAHGPIVPQPLGGHGEQTDRSIPIPILPKALSVRYDEKACFAGFWLREPGADTGSARTMPPLTG